MPARDIVDWVWRCEEWCTAHYVGYSFIDLIDLIAISIFAVPSERPTFSCFIVNSFCKTFDFRHETTDGHAR